MVDEVKTDALQDEQDSEIALISISGKLPAPVAASRSCSSAPPGEYAVSRLFHWRCFGLPSCSFVSNGRLTKDTAEGRWWDASESGYVK